MKINKKLYYLTENIFSSIYDRERCNYDVAFHSKTLIYFYEHKHK